MSFARPMKWIALIFFASLLGLPAAMRAQNQIMGEVQFTGATNIDKDSGVWVDGQYLGYLKELKGDKKVLLLPGEHEISVRQTGYKPMTQKIVLEPGQTQMIEVALEKDPNAQFPKSNAAELKLDVKPSRAAVFLDDGYVGHASDFGGRFHSMLVSPGKHRVKIELPGYQTYETEINLLPGQKSEMKSEMVKGSIQQAGPLVKQARGE